MSSSDEGRLKIMFLDDEATIKHKVKRATQITRDPDHNSVLAILRDILIPMEDLRKQGVLSGTTGGSNEDLVLSDQDKQSARLFKSYRMTEQWFRAGMLSRNDLARVVTKGINDLLSPIRESYLQNSQWQQSNLFGYPGDEG
jgi:tyrosyl-tRNA synthetase